MAFFTATKNSVIWIRPSRIPTVYKHAIDHGADAGDSKSTHEEQLKISRRMREAVVNAGRVGGLPNVHLCPGS